MHTLFKTRFLAAPDESPHAVAGRLSLHRNSR
jgi:hypothetical protein